MIRIQINFKTEMLVLLKQNLKDIKELTSLHARIIE